MIGKRVVCVAAAGLVACGLAGATPAFAQDAPRFELGGQVTTLRLGEFDTTDVGVGVQAGWRLSPMLAIDGLLSWSPGGDEDEFPLVEEQQRVLGLVGVRAGIQRGPFEVFGRVRPGFLQFGERENVPCILIFPTPLECQVLAGKTSFATELGGGVRYNLGAENQMHVSFDIGDLLVRYDGEALRPNGETTEDGFVSNNLLIGIGFGWKF